MVGSPFALRSSARRGSIEASWTGEPTCTVNPAFADTLALDEDSVSAALKMRSAHASGRVPPRLSMLRE